MLSLTTLESMEAFPFVQLFIYSATLFGAEWLMIRNRDSATARRVIAALGLLMICFNRIITDAVIIFAGCILGGAAIVVVIALVLLMLFLPIYFMIRSLIHR